MSQTQTIAQLWRYPVKSMHGERLGHGLFTPNGLEGDRQYAFDSAAAPPGMLRLTGRERRAFLRFKASTIDGKVQVETPQGSRYKINSPALLTELPSENVLTLTYEANPQTDCRPLSLISLQTIQRLEQELGSLLDPRRFRANLYLDLPAPFTEDSWVGRNLRVGPTAVVRILERDPRCRFITLDPDTDQPADPIPDLMKLLDRRHEGRAGVYARVVNPGPIEVGCMLEPIDP